MVATCLLPATRAELLVSALKLRYSPWTRLPSATSVRPVVPSYTLVAEIVSGRGVMVPSLPLMVPVANA